MQRGRSILVSMPTASGAAESNGLFKLRKVLLHAIASHRALANIATDGRHLRHLKLERDSNVREAIRMFYVRSQHAVREMSNIPALVAAVQEATASQRHKMVWRHVQRSKPMLDAMRKLYTALVQASQSVMKGIYQHALDKELGSKTTRQRLLNTLFNYNIEPHRLQRWCHISKIPLRRVINVVKRVVDRLQEQEHPPSQLSLKVVWEKAEPREKQFITRFSHKNNDDDFEASMTRAIQCAMVRFTHQWRLLEPVERDCAAAADELASRQQSEAASS